MPLEQADFGINRSKSGDTRQAACSPDNLCHKAAIRKGEAVHYVGEER
jgi:hypothetical protein